MLDTAIIFVILPAHAATIELIVDYTDAPYSEPETRQALTSAAADLSAATGSEITLLASPTKRVTAQVCRVRFVRGFEDSMPIDKIGRTRNGKNCLIRIRVGAFGVTSPAVLRCVAMHETAHLMVGNWHSDDSGSFMYERVGHLSACLITDDFLLMLLSPGL